MQGLAVNSRLSSLLSVATFHKRANDVELGGSVLSTECTDSAASSLRYRRSTFIRIGLRDSVRDAGAFFSVGVISTPSVECPWTVFERVAILEQFISIGAEYARKDGVSCKYKSVQSALFSSTEALMEQTSTTKCLHAYFNLQQISSGAIGILCCTKRAFHYIVRTLRCINHERQLFTTCFAQIHARMYLNAGCRTLLNRIVLSRKKHIRFSSLLLASLTGHKLFHTFFYDKSHAFTHPCHWISAICVLLQTRHASTHWNGRVENEVGCVMCKVHAMRYRGEFQFLVVVDWTLLRELFSDEIRIRHEKSSRCDMIAFLYCFRNAQKHFYESLTAPNNVVLVVRK